MYDPWVDPEEALQEYGIQPINSLDAGKFDAILLAVAHEQFKQMDIKEIRALGKPDSVIYDLKYLFPADQTDERL